MTPEQALDTCFHIVPSGVYRSHGHHWARLTIADLQGRYFGLCTLVYVHQFHSTH